MRIAIVLPSIITINGTAKQSLELARELRALGHEIHFYTYVYFASYTFPEFNEFLIHICVTEKQSFIARLIHSPSKLEKIYLYIALFQYWQFKRLLHCHQCDILNSNDWFTMWIAAGIKDKSKRIAIINDVPARINNRSLPALIKLYIDRISAHFIDRILVLDSACKQKVIEWLQIHPNKAVIARSGINKNLLSGPIHPVNLHRMFHIKNSSPIIVCANILAPNRRYEDVFDAIANSNSQLEDVHVVILSKLDFCPSYADFLLERVQKNKLTYRVHFVDRYFTDYERLQYIKGADMLVFPNYPQTWGLTVLEAMAIGKPVIVSKGSGVHEVLKHTVHALLYDAGNVKQLRSCIRQVVTDPDIYAAMAKTGRKYVTSTFTMEKYAKKFLSICSE